MPWLPRGRPCPTLVAPSLSLAVCAVQAVVLNTGCSSVPKGLKALAKALVGKTVAKSMQVRCILAYGQDPSSVLVVPQSGSAPPLHVFGHAAMAGKPALLCK